MAIEGPLKELGIEDVLQLLELTRKTGTLAVRSDSLADEAEIHVREGAIVYALRKRSMRRLGHHLIRAGRLTERELDRALEIQKGQPDQRIGQILLEMGSVTRTDLQRQLQFQVEETVYELMGWDEGHFRFGEDEEIADDGMVRVRVESLLMEGARRIDEWSRLEVRIPSLDSTPVLAPGEEGTTAPLELRPDEWEVLAEIDGVRDLQRIAADLGRSSFDVARVVYGLLSTGVVHLHQSRGGVAEGDLDDRVARADALLSAGDGEAALRLAQELEEAFPERPEPALLAGRALAAHGRMRAAAEALGRAVALDPLSPEAHFALGFAAVRTGDIDRATRSWGSFLRLSSEGSRTRRIRAALEALDTLRNTLAEERWIGERHTGSSGPATLE